MTDDELKLMFDTLRQDMRSDFRHEVGVTIEHVDKRFDLLAEANANLDEKVDRKIAALEEQMERGFGDTQAMIKFSHAELDRRVRTLEQNHRALEESHRTLEETLADLQTRVERLESSTH